MASMVKTAKYKGLSIFANGNYEKSKKTQAFHICQIKNQCGKYV